MKIIVLILAALSIACFSRISLAQDTVVLPVATVKGKPSAMIPDGAKSLKCTKQVLVQGTVNSTVKVCTWTNAKK